jgi:hypothetical protein
MKKKANLKTKQKYASENDIAHKEGSSSLETTDYEDFSWINLTNKELLKNYISFPLKIWKGYTSDKIDENRVIRKGFCNQDSASKILTKEIFKNENILTESMEYLAVQKESEMFLDKDNNYIAADFSIKDMDIINFNNMLKKYNYMMKMKFKIKDKVKKINIIGEIKSSKSSMHKETQQINYLYFSQKGDQNTQNVIMYIIDKSFKQFYDMQLPTNLPFVYCYIPKLYYENCYTKYNQILDLLKYDEKNKIQIPIETKKKLKTKIDIRSILGNITFYSICLNILFLALFIYEFFFKK